MKKKLIIFLILLLGINLTLSAYGASKKNKYIQDIEYEAKDGMLIKATLTFPKKKQIKYPLAVMLHSLGASSIYWGNLSKYYRDAGFATLEIDLRGHGKSVYDINLKKRFWGYMNDKAFSKYPEDIEGTLKNVLEKNKKISSSHLVFVGADIGANTAIIITNKMQIKPLVLVLISPLVKIKTLYTPIMLANIDGIPMLAVVGKNDTKGMKDVYELKRYAQNKFEIQAYEHGGTGMQLLKYNPEMCADIVNWTVLEVNNYFEIDKTSQKTRK